MTAFLLHDLGSEAAGAPWREVIPEGWEAPDLPGHGSTPAPRHGAYDPLGPATLARWALDGDGLVVGVGQNAHGALILAAGGGCSAVAIVDGLWGRWRSAEDAVDEMYATIRAMLDDDLATEAPPPKGLDPRTRHGYGVSVSEAFARKFWGAITCPVIAVETPASTTPADERAERVRWFGGDSTLVELDTDDPAAVVAAIVGSLR
ncbi:MAG: hypothetical protein ACJ739_06350 [Acidimicrobiales bacterium]